MPDAHSPAAAHQQHFLPLSAAGVGREASGRLAGGGRRSAAAEGAGRPRRGGGAKRAGGLWGRGRAGVGARLGPTPSRAPAAAGRTQLPLRVPSPPSLPLRPAPVRVRASGSACAEPPTYCSRWRCCGVGRPRTEMNQ